MGKTHPLRRLGGAVLTAAVLGCAGIPHTAAMPVCVVGDMSAPTRDTLYVVGVEARNDGAGPTDCGRHSTAGSPVLITEVPTPGNDLRDVLDRGLPATNSPPPDVVVTRELNVLAYAEGSSDYIIFALPYNRTYLLVARDSAPAVPSQAERDALARDAVTADARGASQPFVWLSDSTCIAPIAASYPASTSIVAYAAGDVIARQLAERIVALVGVRTRPSWIPERLATAATVPRVAAIDADSIADALATGRAAVAVVALSRDPRTPCGTSKAPVPWRGVPLVDSRAHVIVRRGSGAAFIIGADGALRFTRRVP